MSGFLRCIDGWIKFFRKKDSRKKGIHKVAPLDVFAQGKNKVGEIVVDSKGLLPPPKPLLIAHPTEGGLYPTLIFLHGFTLKNFMYRELLHHVASHGFIVVVPQVSCVLPSCMQFLKRGFDLLPTVYASTLLATSLLHHKEREREKELKMNWIIRQYRSGLPKSRNHKLQDAKNPSQ